MSNYTDASYVAHNRSLPNYPVGQQWADDIDAAHLAADAIVRLAGIDTLVADDEFDPEVGYKYFLSDGNVFIVKSDGTVALVDAEGQPTTTLYAQPGQLDALRFSVEAGYMRMHQRGQFIAAEPLA